MSKDNNVSTTKSLSGGVKRKLSTLYQNLVDNKKITKSDMFLNLCKVNASKFMDENYSTDNNHFQKQS